MTRGLFRPRRRKEEAKVKPERGIYRPRFRSRNGVSRIVRDNYGPAKAYHVIVQEVLERDGHQCRHLTDGRACGSNSNLQVHHIKPLSQGGVTEKGNMITLCSNHHANRHSHLAMELKT